MTDTLQEKFHTIEQSMADRFVARADFSRAMTLALLTRENVVALGPPGTGKSKFVRDYLEHVTGSKFFEVLMGRALPDSAVLGPISVPELRDNGRFVRNDTGYMTDTDFAFLDEGFKASATLANSLLAAMNERIAFDVDHGKASRPIPLHTTVVASNESWRAIGEEARPFWDRLLFRLDVKPITKGTDFAKLLLSTGGDDPIIPCMNMADLHQAVEEVKLVTIPQKVVTELWQLHKRLKADLAIVTSERRWRQVLKVLQAVAWLDARQEVRQADIAELTPCLWEEASQIGELRNLLQEFADPSAKVFAQFRDDLATAEKTINEHAGTSGSLSAPDSLALVDASRRLSKVRDQIQQVGGDDVIRQELLGQIDQLIQKANTRLTDFS